MAPICSKQDEDLMQLTLQVRNRKDNDEKYAKFRGDNLIGVREDTPSADFCTDTSVESNLSQSRFVWRYCSSIPAQ